MTIGLKDKVAVVTGGSTGIGRACAIQFGEAGAHVAIVARHQERGAAVVKELTDAGGQAIFISADVSQADEVEAAMADVVNRFGRLDIAINNAAPPPSEIGALTPIVEMAVEHFDRMVAVTLKGPWLGMKYQIAHMLKTGGGSIVNVSSIAGGRGMKGMSHYTAGKFGLNGLTRSIALEYADANIRVNAVMPGPVESAILLEMEQRSPGYSKVITGMVPMARMGTTDEIARAVVWLASDAAAYITGTVLAVDGGILA